MSNEATAALAFIAVAMVVCGWLAVWSRRDTLGRHLSMLALLAGLAAVALAAVATAGWPMPLNWEWHLEAETKVVGAHFDPGRAIYILVARRSGMPKVYRLPWDERTARELKEAMDMSAEQTGEAGALMKWPIDPSVVEMKPQFYPVPQLASPPKEAPVPAPFYGQ